MATIFDTAKFILDSRDKTTAMELQKYCYYVKAWGNVFSIPTFSDEFEAWDDGPVCVKLFKQFQGKKEITDYSNMPASDEILDDQLIDLIKAVLRVYGEKNGKELSSLTHLEAPWKNAIKQGRNTSISDASMKEYYCTQRDPYDLINDKLLYLLAERRIKQSNDKIVPFSSILDDIGDSDEDIEAASDTEYEVEQLVF